VCGVAEFEQQAAALSELISSRAPARRGRGNRIDEGLLEALTSLRRDQLAGVARTDHVIAEVRAWLEITSRRGDDLGGRLEWLIESVAQDREAITDHIRAIDRRVAADVPLHGPAGLVLEEFDAGLGTPVVGFRTAAGDAGADAYAGFEDWFRGSEAEIRERQRVYLRLCEGHAPVLDVGCGRGEFLELLREAGIAAQGIDLDPAMVRRCHDRGLTDVRQADAVGYLAQREPGSVGVVFAAQVVEHLPYDSLLAFLRAARRALAPGGALIAETVNPHAPQALKHFWIDPTHQHPLFPEVLVALCRLTGYGEAFMWFPHGTGSVPRDRLEQPDYAVVARTD
jgi:SAM-dependent methyltransferase